MDNLETTSFIIYSLSVLVPNLNTSHLPTYRCQASAPVRPATSLSGLVTYFPGCHIRSGFTLRHHVLVLGFLFPSCPLASFRDKLQLQPPKFTRVSTSQPPIRDQASFKALVVSHRRRRSLPITERLKGSSKQETSDNQPKPSLFFALMISPAAATFSGFRPRCNSSSHRAELFTGNLSDYLSST